VAEEIENCEDFSKLIMKRPFDRVKRLIILLLYRDISLTGIYKNRFGLCRKLIQMWEKRYKTSVIAQFLQFNPSNTQLLLTEPYFNPESLRTNMYEIIFEDYQFESLCTVCPATLALLDANMNRAEYERA
jgi:hypothetical protein